MSEFYTNLLVKQSTYLKTEKLEFTRKCPEPDYDSLAVPEIIFTIATLST